jgi:tetratricopeptide (TPR) repeat protein
MLLEQTCDQIEKLLNYNQLECVKLLQCDYEKAIWYYAKAIHVQQNVLRPDHASSAIPYSNIGFVYDSMEKYSKALSFYEKSLKIQQKTLPSNHPNLSTSYNNNISVLYYKMRNYSKALSYLERVLDIKQRSLLPSHPTIQNLRKNIESIKDSFSNNV